MADESYKPPQPGEMNMTIRYEDPASGRISHTTKDFSLREGWTPFGDEGFWLYTNPQGNTYLKTPTGINYSREKYEKYYGAGRAHDLGPQGALMSSTRDTRSIKTSIRHVPFGGHVVSHGSGNSVASWEAFQRSMTTKKRGNPNDISLRALAADFVYGAMPVRRMDGSQLYAGASHLGGSSTRVSSFKQNDFRFSYFGRGHNRSGAINTSDDFSPVGGDIDWDRRSSIDAAGFNARNAHAASLAGLGPDIRSTSDAFEGLYGPVRSEVARAQFLATTRQNAGNMFAPSAHFKQYPNAVVGQYTRNSPIGTTFGGADTPIVSTGFTYNAREHKQYGMGVWDKEAGGPASSFWGDKAYNKAAGEAFIQRRTGGVEWSDTQITKFRDTVEKVNKGLKDTFLSTPPTNSVIAQMTRIAGGGSPGGGPPGGGPPGGGGGGRGRGALGQFGEQLRHAAIWQMYTPLLAAPAAYGYAASSPFASKAAMELQGLGATRAEMETSIRRGYVPTSDPFRSPQQAITSDKWVISSFGMEPTIEGQIEARGISKYLPYAAKATELQEEKITQLMSRGSTILGDPSISRKDQALQMLSGLVASGQLTDVKGQEILQAIQHGGSAFSAKMGGNKMAEALSYIVPLAQAGVPNIGRGYQHWLNPNTMAKMAESQVLSEINAKNMAAHGGNLAYAIGEKEFKKLLKGKGQQGEDLRTRLQQAKIERSAASTAKEQYKYQGLYGAQMKWADEHGIAYPATDAIFLKSSLGISEITGSPEGKKRVGGLQDEIYAGVTGSKAVHEVDKAPTIFTPGADINRTKMHLEAQAGENKKVKQVTRYAADTAAEGTYQTNLRAYIESAHTPEQKKALIQQEFEAYKESIYRGEIKLPYGVTPERRFANYINTIGNRKEIEKFRDSMPHTPGMASWVLNNLSDFPGFDWFVDKSVNFWTSNKSKAKGSTNLSEQYGFKALPEGSGLGRGAGSILSGLSPYLPADSPLRKAIENLSLPVPFVGNGADPISESDVKEPFKGIKIKDGYLQVTIDPSQVKEMMAANSGYSISAHSEGSGGKVDFLLKPSPEKKSPADSTIAPPPEPYSRQWGIAGRGARYSNYYGSGYYTEGEY